jgi:pimeloyl-ACP methyl ester carboxylesterase
MLGALLAALAAVLVVLVILLALASPGRPRPVLDGAGQVVPGSIAEKLFLDVNGTRQGVFIRSRDPRNPVLLYVHGGMPDYFLDQTHPTGLEQDFTMVWWEQRGAGISSAAASPGQPVTVEQLVADTITVADLLRARFAVEKVYLMGHSGGTFIGIQAAARAPDRFHAYLGVAQVAYQLESEVRAHAAMLDRARRDGDRASQRRLEAAPVSMAGGLSRDYLKLRDPMMHSMGMGTMHAMHSLVTGLFLPSLAFPEYTVKEKLDLWTAKARSGVSVVWDAMLGTDLKTHVPRLEIPVYFFEGVYDATCNAVLAREYFDALHAPVKGFYWFHQSAHSPLFEEPDRLRHLLREDVLKGRSLLADVR